MNLEELLSNTKTKAVYLFEKSGKLIDHYPESEDELNKNEKKITAFSATVFNMVNHFFQDFFESETTNVVMKSNKENIVLVKHEDFILCFFSDKNINLGLLGVSLKINNK